MMDYNFMYEANNLKLIDLESNSVLFSDIKNENIDSLLKENFVGKSYVVVWLDYKVLIGACSNGVLCFCNDETFDYKYVQRLRVFDLQKELLIWRSSGKWNGRMRTDNLEGKGTVVVEAKQVVYGTDVIPVNEQFTEIREKRATKLKLNIPFTNMKVDDKQNRIFIKTFNYTKTNAVNQVTYFDCRFVEFTDNQKAL